MADLGGGKSFFGNDVPDIALRSLFKKYDYDGNNVLSCDELMTLLRDDLAMTAEEAESYAYLLDKDGSRRISYDEFKSWLQSNERFVNLNNKSRYYALRKAVELFKRYDVDHSGCLDRSELMTLMVHCGGKPEYIEQQLQGLDQDGNGVISFSEFLKWLNWLPQGQW